MADNCSYFTSLDGNVLICPETDPDEVRCTICMLISIYDRRLTVPQKTPIAGKLPAPSEGE